MGVAFPYLTVLREVWDVRVVPLGSGDEIISTETNVSLLSTCWGEVASVPSSVKYPIVASADSYRIVKELDGTISGWDHFSPAQRRSALRLRLNLLSPSWRFSRRCHY